MAAPTKDEPGSRSGRKTRTGVGPDTQFVEPSGRKSRARVPSLHAFSSVPRRQQNHAFHPDFLRPIALMLAGGATDYEIAEAVGVSTRTLYNWRNESPELYKMMLDSKDGFDIRIERTLAASALGYTYPAEKIFMQDGQVVRVPYIEHVKPDTTAAIFWLKNRQPERWRDVQRHEVEDTTPSAEEPSDARKVAMAMLNVIRQGMMKRGELAPPPAFTKEFEHVTTQARSETGAEARAGRPADAAPADRAGQDDGARGGSVARSGVHDAEGGQHGARQASRIRRAFGGDSDEGDGPIDLD